MFEEMIDAIQEETIRRIYSFRLKTQEEIKRERVATGITEGFGGDKTVKKQPRKVQKSAGMIRAPAGAGRSISSAAAGKRQRRTSKRNSVGAGFPPPQVKIGGIFPFWEK